MTINTAERRSEWDNSCCAQSVQSEMGTNISPLCFPSIRKLLRAAIYSPSHYFLFLFCVNNVTFWKGKRCLSWKGRSGRNETPPSRPPIIGDTFPNSSRCRDRRWRRAEAFATTYFPRPLSLHNAPGPFQPRDISPPPPPLCCLQGFSEVRQSFPFFCLLSASKLGLC